MKVNTTYECENCHKVFNTKEEALVHERDGECETLENIYVKQIYVDHNYCGMRSFIVHSYPNAKYKKSNNTIQLYQNGNFISNDKFHFDIVQVEYDEDCLGDDTPYVFTMNTDYDHEIELMNKLIDYEISNLKDKKEEIDKEIDKWEHTKVTKKISYNEESTWVPKGVLK